MRRVTFVGIAASAALAGGLLVSAPAEAAPGDPVSVRPERTIIGTKAGAKPPWDVHLSASGRTYAADFHRDRVVVYRAGARGKARPLYSLRGSRSGVFEPRGVARDSAGRLYVANGNNRVLVFGKNARGNVRPIRVLRAGMAVGSVSMTPDNRLMVSGSGGVKIYRRSASGNAKPVREISGDKTQLQYAFDVRMNVDGRIWATFDEAEILTVFAPGAKGNVAPERTITQEGPGLWEPELLAFDRAGRAYIGTHEGHVTVLRHDATGRPAPLFVLSDRRHGHVNGLSVSRTGKVAVSGRNKIVVYPRLRAVTAPWAVRGVSVSGSPTATNRVVRWAQPLADGGASITGYRVTVKQGNRKVKAVTLKASRRSYALKRRNLPAGTSTVLVRAKNRKGYGPGTPLTFTVTR
ncbi:fibronectin type III domain-containing protein [Mumia sp. zg.B21]|uniref:fibronectin type III domain-containing protein n=1 Tax=Mumia sp. zg.B21 TaxID=2855447 RepID=UPI001C6E0FBC|nr:fibronectin type III domain-containing protein [Mumia sp. zg.B21]MBW9208607.1 fibronectin type III domain-containing protein [Mumia sp. zg.B21]